MRIFSKITAALLAVAVAGVCVPNVVYAGGHHARAVTVNAHCYQDAFFPEAICYQDGVCTGNGICDVYGICQNGGICAGTVSQPQIYSGYYPDYNFGCYSGYGSGCYSGHHSGRGHGMHHY